MIPIRLAEHVLQALFVGLDHCLFHPFHVLALRLHQPVEILSRSSKDRPGLALEMAAIARAEAEKLVGNLMNQIDGDISIVN